MKPGSVADILSVGVEDRWGYGEERERGPQGQPTRTLRRSSSETGRILSYLRGFYHYPDVTAARRDGRSSLRPVFPHAFAPTKKH